MSKSQRLASFNGPSTPTKQPVRVVSNPPSPASQRTTETTFHRKVRTLLLDLRLAVVTWRDLVLIDGLKCIKTIIDGRTELDNQLNTYGVPTKPLMISSLRALDTKIVDLDIVLRKLTVQFNKMNAILDEFESLITEAHRMKGWSWVTSEPLWCSWSLDRFYASVLPLLPQFAHSLDERKELILALKSHDLSFERSKEALKAWSNQAFDAWDELEDICSVEVQGWPVYRS